MCGKRRDLMTKTDIITMVQGVARKACTLELAPESADIIAPERPVVHEPETVPEPVSEFAPESAATVPIEPVVESESIHEPAPETPEKDIKNPAKSKKKRIRKPTKSAVTPEPVPEPVAERVVTEPADLVSMPGLGEQEHGEATVSADIEAPEPPPPPSAAEVVGPARELEALPGEPIAEPTEKPVEPIHAEIKPSEPSPEPSTEKPVRAAAKSKKRARTTPGPAGNPFGSGFKPAKKVEPACLPMVYQVNKGDLSIHRDQRKTINELTSETCRWPVGTPGSREFFFCGGQTLDGNVYCKTHTKRAYSVHTLARIGVRRET
jgi:hypothetical protein